MTKKLLEEALTRVGGQKKNDFSGLTYLAPATQKRKEAQGLFHAAVSPETRGKGYIPPLMMTPGQLAKKLLREHSQRSLLLPSWLKVPLLMKLSGKNAGYAATLAGFMREMKAHFPGRKAAEILETISPLIAELGIAEEIGLRLESTMATISLYEQRLNALGFIDPDGPAPEAAALIRGENENENEKIHGERFPLSALILDGFYEVTPAEKLLISALIERAGKTAALVPFDERRPEITENYLSFLKAFPHRQTGVPAGSAKNAKLSYYAYPSREQEVEAAARRIKVNYISGAFTGLSKTAVILPNPPDYTDMLERVFKKYGVPCSFSPGGAGNSVKARREKDLLAVLKTVFPFSGCYGATDLAAVLSSPFFAGIPEELGRWAPKITLSSVSGGFENWLGLEGAPTGPKGLKWLKKRLSPLEKAMKEGKTGSSQRLINGYIEALKGLEFSALGAFSFEDELEDRLHGLLLLDAMCGEGLAPEEFMDCVSLAASGIDEETEEPGVRILSFGEAEGLEPEGLYFLGLKDGEIPRRPETDFFLPERLRAKLGLRTMKKNLLLEEFQFGRLISGAGFVHLSYPDMEGDKLFLPSILISEGNPLKDPAYGVFSKEEEFIRKGRLPYSVYLDEIKDVKDRIPFGTNSKRAVSVTDVDALRACPRFFFLDRVMGLAPPEAQEFGIDAKTAGTLLHRIMEELLPFTVQDSVLDSFRSRAGKVIDKVLAENPVHPYWGRLLKESFLAALPSIHEIEKKFSLEGFTLAMPEYRVEGELKGVKLKGKIDRIDENRETGDHMIMDYKSGPAALSPSDVLKKGATLQLFLYAALAEAVGIKDIRKVGIYSFKDMKVKMVPGSRDISAGRTMEDFIEAALAWLEETARMVRGGDFPADPISEQNCRICHEKPYCPYIHSNKSKGGHSDKSVENKPETRKRKSKE